MNGPSHIPAFADGEIVLIQGKTVATVVRTNPSGRIVVRVVHDDERTTFTHDEFFGVMMEHTRPGVQTFGIDPSVHSVERVDDALLDGMLGAH